MAAPAEPRLRPPPSPVEVQVRVIGHLLDIADRRRPLLDDLAATLVVVVDTLDPLHERDSAPTWLRDWTEPHLPPGVHLDGLNRLRRAADALPILEVQAQVVCDDIRALMPGGPAARPGGLGVWEALDTLAAMAVRRDGYLSEMLDAERCAGVHDHLPALLAADLRRQVRRLQAEQREAATHRTRLLVLRPT